MIAKRLLVGLVALGLPTLAVLTVEAPSSVRAQQQPPFLVPHGDYTAESDTCRVCHAWHADPQAGLFPDDQLLLVPNQPTVAEPQEIDVCFACHDGSAAETNVLADLTEDTRVSSHPVLEPRNQVQTMCSDCHAQHQSPDEDIKLLYRETSPGVFVFSPPDNPIGDTFCYGCHGSASTLPAPFGDHALFETSIHASGQVEPPTPGTDLKCSACHEAHASDHPYLTRAGGEDLCFTCHSSADPNTANGSNVEDAFSAAQNDYTPGSVQIYHHPIAAAEQDGGLRTVECASCHNPHLVNRTETANDPEHVLRMDSGWKFDWDADSGLYNRSPNAADFCGTCHRAPDETQPLVADGTDVPYDVNLVDDGRHDRFTLTDYASSAHGDPGFVSADYAGCPPGEPCSLACTACHDFHGSSNAYMLRETVIAPDDVAFTVTGATWAAGEVTLTLTPPDRIGEGISVTVSGISPDGYNGTFTTTNRDPGATITYALALDPGTYVSGGTASVPDSSTMTGFAGSDTGEDPLKLQAFCLTCHTERGTEHHSGDLCTQCHDHGSNRF